MNILVIGAHPDDEVLGVGGTMARLVAEGHRVHVLIVAERVGLRHDGITDAIIQGTVRAANAVLGVEDIYFGGFGTSGLLDEHPSRQIVALIKETIAKSGAEFIFTHHPHDINSDHRVIAQSTMYATYGMGLSTVHKILCYEVLSSTEQAAALWANAFIPTTYYDVAAYLDRKVEAFSYYTTEIHTFPHPRSLEATRILAQFRGLTMAITAAEAFTTVKELV